MNYIRNGTKMNNLRTREVEIKEERDFPWVKIKKKKKMVETKEVRWQEEDKRRKRNES